MLRRFYCQGIFLKSSPNFTSDRQPGRAIDAGIRPGGFIHDLFSANHTLRFQCQTNTQYVGVAKEVMYKNPRTLDIKPLEIKRQILLLSRAKK